MAREAQDFIAAVRTGTGKGAARQARREGNVPAIVYGDGKAPVALNISYNYLLKRLKQGHQNDKFASAHQERALLGSRCGNHPTLLAE